MVPCWTLLWNSEAAASTPDAIFHHTSSIDHVRFREIWRQLWAFVSSSVLAWVGLPSSERVKWRPGINIKFNMMYNVKLPYCSRTCLAFEISSFNIIPIAIASSFKIPFSASWASLRSFRCVFWPFHWLSSLMVYSPALHILRFLYSEWSRLDYKAALQL